MKFIKYTLIVLVTLAVLAGGAAAAGVWYVQQADLRELFVTMVNKTTGYKVTMDGAVNVQLFPQPALSAEALTVHAFHGDKPLVQVQNVQAKLTWGRWYIFGIGLQELTMDAPNVYLHQPAKGLANWESPWRRGSSAGGGLPFSEIHKIAIDHATVTYVNEQSKQEIVGQKMHMHVTGEDPRNTQIDFAGVLNDVPVKAELTADLTSWDAMPVQAKMDSALAHIELDGQVRDGANYVGQINMQIPDVQRALAQFRVQGVLMDADPLPLSVEGKITQDGQNITLTNTVIALGNAVTMEGDVSLVEKNMQLNAVVDQLDLNALKLCGQPKKSSSGKPWNDSPLDFAGLGGLPFSLKAFISDFKCQGVPVQQVQLQLENDGRKLDIKQFDAKLMDGGTLTVTGGLDMIGTPRGELAVDIQAMPVEGFLTGHLQEKIHVPLDGQMVLKFRGKTSQQMANSLDGSVKLQADEGQLPTGIISALAGRIDQFLTKTVSEGAVGSNKLNKFVADYTVTNGVARADQLLLEAADGQIQVRGSGKIDLANWTIAHRLEPVVQGSVIGLTVPVNIRGALDNPAFEPVVITKENLATGLGAVIGGPAGAAVGNMIGRALDGNVNPTENVSATKSVSKTGPVIKTPGELLQGIFNK